MRRIALLVPLLASPALAQMSVSAVRETQKIRPTDPPPASPAGSISLSCAQNEFCAFQVEVSAGAASVTVSDVSLSALAEPGGGTLADATPLVYTEGFLDITTPSNGAGATGEWPDPLIPAVDDFYHEPRNAFPVTVAAGQNQPFFVEVHVPTGQAPGTYAGEATVTASDGSTASVAVAIQVRGFALPSTSSLPSAYGFGWDGPCVGHFGGYGAPSCDDQQLEALNALYFQDALNHRISISELVYAPPIADGGGSWTTFDALYGPFLDGGALTGADQLQGAALTEIAFTADDTAPATYAAWAQHFQANGWYDKLFDYTCDEPPNGCAWTDIPPRAANAHAGDPNFRTLVTTSIGDATQAGVLSSIDILVPIINAMWVEGQGSQQASYQSFLAQPDSFVWMYQSCEPSSSCAAGTEGGQTGWPTMFIDEPAITNRVMQWMDFAYDAEAELYYETTYAMETQADAWQSQYEFGNNGDGSIWYPGKPSVIGGTHDIPVESFRMKMLREGFQDYEYLHLLDTLNDDAFARGQLATVVTGANDFTADPAVLEAARLAMAAEIEKDLGSATGGSTGGVAGGSTGAGTGGTSGTTASGGATGAAAGSSGSGGSAATSSSGGSGSGGATAGGASGGRGTAMGSSGSGGTGTTAAAPGGTNGGGAGGTPSATGSCGCSSSRTPVGLDALLPIVALASLRRRRVAGRGAH